MGNDIEARFQFPKILFWKIFRRWVLGGIGGIGFLEYLRRVVMASRVVSLWMTSSIFINQGNDIYFEVGFLYTGHRKVCGRQHTDRLFGVFKYDKDSHTVDLFDNFCYDYTERMKRLVINEIKKLIETKPSVLDRKERCGAYYDIKQWGRIDLSGGEMFGTKNDKGFYVVNGHGVHGE